MTYGNVTTNLNNCVEVQNPKAVAVIDTRTIDEYGFKKDGQIKYLLPSFSNGYKGDITDCLILWGGDAASAWQAIDKITREKSYLCCKTVEQLADHIKDISESVRGEVYPSFAFVGYERHDGKHSLVMKAVYEGKTMVPPPNFFEIGSPILIGHDCSDAETDELIRADTGKLTYTGINRLVTDKTDNVLVGGTPAIITFEDGAVHVTDTSYGSFLCNLVTARQEEWPDYRRRDAYADIEAILGRSKSFGQARHLVDAELRQKIQGDRQALDCVSQVIYKWAVL